MVWLAGFRIRGVVEQSKRDRASVEMAVAMLRVAGRVLPGVGPDLAGSLRLLARCFLAEGEPERALETVAEAVRICRRGTRIRPGRNGVELALSLSTRADVLRVSGRAEQAVAVARESLALCRAGCLEDPRHYGPALLVALDSLAWALGEAGEAAESWALGVERIGILMKLAERRPRYYPMVPLGLLRLGVYAGSAGESADALRATGEAIHLYERLERERPGSVAEPLGAALHNRELFLRQLQDAGNVILGPYPLCRYCEQVNGGLLAVRHRQEHVRFGDRQACIDTGIADLVATLWERGCDTRNSCQDVDGRAMVTPAAGQADKAVEILAGIGIHAEKVGYDVYFAPPADG